MTEKPMTGMDEVLRKAIDDAQAASEAAMTPERLAAYDRREAQARRTTLLEESRPAVTPEMRAAIIAGTEPASTHALNVVRRWHRMRGEGGAFPRVLVLCGGTGTGKTVAAAWMLAREPGRYIVAPDALASSQKRDAEWYRVRDCFLLVLDDVGTCTDEARERAMFYEVVNARLSGGWTLVTTNLTSDAFKAWLDQRTASRLSQVGLIQDMRGRDMRVPVQGAAS